MTKLEIVLYESVPLLGLTLAACVVRLLVIVVICS